VSRGRAHDTRFDDAENRFARPGASHPSRALDRFVEA
jgi:hypothetical protein